MERSSRAVIGLLGSAPPTERQLRNRYPALCEQQDARAVLVPMRPFANTSRSPASRPLMQMLAAESAEMRLGLVKYLTGVPHVEATQGLARWRSSRPKTTCGTAAIDALEGPPREGLHRHPREGLRYPWPAVAKRAADAIARTGTHRPHSRTRRACSTQADPRLPAIEGRWTGRRCRVVREMVKMNHHRNCMMCHAPGNPGTRAGDAITAEVAVQGQPLPLAVRGLPAVVAGPDDPHRRDLSAAGLLGDAAGGGRPPVAGVAAVRLLRPRAEAHRRGGGVYREQAHARRKRACCRRTTRRRSRPCAT